MTDEILLLRILANQIKIMLALSRHPDTPITVGEDLRAAAEVSRKLLRVTDSDDQITKSPRSS